MVRSAYEEFGLKVPDYLLASVGTMVYKREGDKLSLDPNWIDYVYTKHPEWDREEISLKLDAIEELEYQEEEVQNEFKISFYVKTEEDKEEIEKAVHQMLEGREGIEIVYSVDPHKDRASRHTANNRDQAGGA